MGYRQKMKNNLLTLFYGFLASLSMILALPSHADNTQQKQNQLKKQISSTSTSLANSRQVSNNLRKKVIAAEDKLNIISRKLHSTEREINRITTKLNKSNVQKAKLEKQTREQKNALAQQMQALYTSGKQSHLRLLLKQDDPSDISRTIKYFEYLNQHRLKRIKEINKHLQKIKAVEIQIRKDSASLKKLQKEQSQRKKELKKVLTEKERSLKKQRKVVISQEKKLAKLKREESRLKNVIEQLAAKQRLERNKEETRKNNRKNQKNKAVKQVQTRPRFVPNKPFSSLKGKLSWPVRGTILHRYGSIRNSKQKWKAVVISAPGGTNVHAVARGKVEYSGRLNGYGFIIIIRHDKNYRSIYGYNRSVFKKTGDIVKAGEVIAAVGNSGGIKNTGLYFEIRKSTIHQNPAKWCR